jgi:uncharacterized glyoxalase superfamily protein PhnB
MAPPATVPYPSHVDAGAAIDFLERALGLVRPQAFDGLDGRPMQGGKAHRSGVVMLGGVDAPAATGSLGISLVVNDVDDHHARAVAAGAAIVHPLEDTEFGTRRSRAREPGRREWSFGSYAPAAKPDA